MTRQARLFALTFAMLFLPATAMAQAIGEATAIHIAPDLYRDDVAGTRAEPGFGAQTVRSGGITLEGSLSLGSAGDTNVFNRDNATLDALGLITGRLNVRSESEGLVLELGGASHMRRFVSKDAEDSSEYAIHGLAEVALTPGATVFASAAYTHAVEDRSATGSAASADAPAKYDALAGEVGVQLNFGPLWARPSVQFEITDFEDLPVASVVQDQSFRNEVNATGQLAVGVSFTEAFAAFAEVRQSEIDADDAAANVARDGQDRTVMVGLRGEITPLIWAEIAVGYRSNEFDLARFSDHDGLTYRADVQWYVTQLMSFRLEASQSVLSSGAVQVGRIDQDRAKLTGYFDTLPNLRFALSIEYEADHFRETDTDVQRATSKLVAEYRLNPHMSVGGFVAVRRQVLGGQLLVPEFDAVSAGVGVTLTP